MVASQSHRRAPVEGQVVLCARARHRRLLPRRLWPPRDAEARGAHAKLRARQCRHQGVCALQQRIPMQQQLKPSISPPTAPFFDPPWRSHQTCLAPLRGQDAGPGGQPCFAVCDGFALGEALSSA